MKIGPVSFVAIGEEFSDKRRDSVRVFGSNSICVLLVLRRLA
jgi:hypothetical protein